MINEILLLTALYINIFVYIKNLTFDFLKVKRFWLKVLLETLFIIPISIIIFLWCVWEVQYLVGRDFMCNETLENVFLIIKYASIVSILMITVTMLISVPLSILNKIVITKNNFSFLFLSLIIYSLFISSSMIRAQYIELIFQFTN